MVIFLFLLSLCFIVLNAVGLASFDLYDDVDFEGWFSSCLREELKVQHSKYAYMAMFILPLLEHNLELFLLFFLDGNIL